MQQTAAIVAAAKQPTKISTLRQMSNLDPTSFQDKRCHGLEVVRRQGPGVGRDQKYKGAGGREGSSLEKV